MPTADDFAAIDIRIGTILRAEPFPEARKPAFRLLTAFGPKIGLKRSSAQITVHYQPAQLEGRQIAAVVNIGERRVAGFVSQVLVLGALPQPDEIVLLAVDHTGRQRHAGWLTAIGVIRRSGCRDEPPASAGGLSFAVRSGQPIDRSTCGSGHGTSGEDESARARDRARRRRCAVSEAPQKRPPNRVQVMWAGGEAFDGGRPGGKSVRVDGTGQTGPGPVDAVLIGLAGCSSIDIVQILAKRRTPVRSLTIEVTGHRVDRTPRRLTRIELEFRIAGDGIEREHAERAIELGLNKYCSVRDSLARDIAIEWTLILE